MHNYYEVQTHIKYSNYASKSRKIQEETAAPQKG